MGRKILIIRPFTCQTQEDALARGYTFCAQVGVDNVDEVRSKIVPSEIPQGSLLLASHPIHLGEDLPKFLRVIALVLDRGAEVLCGQIDTRGTSACGIETKRLLLYLTQLPRSFRALRIKEGLSLARLRGTQIGRSPITEELKAEVLNLSNQGLSIREIESHLLRRISKSAIHSVIQAAKKKTGGAS